MNKLFWFCCILVCIASSAKMFGATVFTSNKIIIAPVDNVSLYDTAKFCIIRSILSNSSLNQLSAILENRNDLSINEKRQLLTSYSELLSANRKMFMTEITKFRTTHGRDKVTHLQGLLYAVYKKSSIASYIEDYKIVIPELKQEFDFSLLSIAIDNNTPVILTCTTGKVYLCLGYSDDKLITADMEKVTGIIDIPVLPRVERLRKEKNLSKFDQNWLEEIEEKIKKDDLQKYYVEFVFNENTRNAPFIFELAKDSFDGEMTIIFPGKLNFQAL